MKDMLKSLFARSVFATNGTGAGGGTGAPVPLTNPLGQGTGFLQVAEKIADLLTTIAIPIVGIMVVVGGFQIMTAGGDPEKYKTGKKTILYAAIGFAVVLLAESVVTIINDFVNAPVS